MSTPSDKEENKKKPGTLVLFSVVPKCRKNWLGLLPGAVFLCAFVSLSFLLFLPHTVRAETRADSELIDYEWTVNEDTWKNDTNLLLEANITIQNNASLYLSNSRLQASAGNLSFFSIWLKDNASLVLHNSTVEGFHNDSSMRRGGEGNANVSLVIVTTNAHLRIYNSSLGNTAVHADRSTADFVGVSASHEGFNFSEWNNSSLRLISSTFLSGAPSLNGVLVNGQEIYRKDSDENNSRSFAFSRGSQEYLHSFSITNSTTFSSVSSDFSRCLVDSSSSVSLSELLSVSFFDGANKAAAGKGSGYIEFYLDGTFEENVSVLKNETYAKTSVPVFSHLDNVSTVTRNISLICHLVEEGRVVGRREINHASESLREMTPLELFFYPELKLEQPRFYYKDKEVSTIAPGNVLKIKVCINNIGSRTVRFNIYFYILFNVEKVFDEKQDVALKYGESRIFTGHWDSSADDYPMQTWSLKVTVDNTTPPEKNSQDSEVSKTIRLTEDGDEETVYFEIMVFSFSLLFLLFSVYILFLKRAEIFGNFTVDDVMLLDKAGRLLGHFSHKEHVFDRAVVGSMLQAIQDFVNVSFHEKESDRLKSLKHGDKMILVEYGDFASLAVVIQGTPSGELRHEMVKLVYQIHAIYGDALSHWDGDISGFPEVKIMLENLASKRFGIGYEFTKFIHFVKDELSRTPGDERKRP